MQFPVDRVLSALHNGKGVFVCIADIDRIPLMDQSLIVLDLEDEPKRVDRFLTDETDGVNGRVGIIDGLFFGYGRFLDEFDGTFLNNDFWLRNMKRECVLTLFLKKPNTFTGIDPVGIGNLFVFLPQFRPIPRRVKKFVRQVPERISSLNRVIESSFVFYGFFAGTCCHAG